MGVLVLSVRLMRIRVIYLIRKFAMKIKILLPSVLLIISGYIDARSFSSIEPDWICTKTESYQYKDRSYCYHSFAGNCYGWAYDWYTGNRCVKGYNKCKPGYVLKKWGTGNEVTKCVKNIRCESGYVKVLFTTKKDGRYRCDKKTGPSQKEIYLKALAEEKKSKKDLDVALKKSKNTFKWFIKLYISANDKTKRNAGVKDFLVLVYTHGKAAEEWVLLKRANVKKDQYAGLVMDFKKDERTGLITIYPERKVVFSAAKVTDWAYLKNGRRYGGFRWCVYKSKVLKKYKEAYLKRYRFKCPAKVK